MKKEIEELESEESEGELKQIGGLKQLRTCQICHGNDFNGLVGPSLLNLGDSFSFNTFKRIVGRGRGDMPANPGINDVDMKRIYDFLNNRGNSNMAKDKKSKNVNPVCSIRFLAFPLFQILNLWRIKFLKINLK